MSERAKLIICCVLLSFMVGDIYLVALYFYLGIVGKAALMLGVFAVQLFLLRIGYMQEANLIWSKIKARK